MSIALHHVSRLEHYHFGVTVLIQPLLVFSTVDKPDGNVLNVTPIVLSVFWSENYPKLLPNLHPDPRQRAFRIMVRVR